MLSFLLQVLKKRRGSVTSHSMQVVAQKSSLLQHCSSCFHRSRIGIQGNQQPPCRTIFNFFKELMKEPPKRPPPTYPVIHDLGKVSPMRTVPDHIEKPEWADNKIVNKKPLHPQPLNVEDQVNIREVGKLARHILNFAASILKVGVTTDYIDEQVHNYCIEKGVYPSCLNYYGFPKSICTSINNVWVHGIPDDRPLHDGDILNVDLTIYQHGLHVDLSETYLIGNVDDAGKRLVNIARLCRDEAIKQCGPDIPISVIGDVIHAICKEHGVVVGQGMDGHGIGRYFHCKPHIWHYRNAYPERMEKGMAFTIEPVILERPDRICKADDMWTMFGLNHTRSAQFEHTILITQTGYDVLTASDNELLNPTTMRAVDGADNIVKGQFRSGWGFKE